MKNDKRLDVIGWDACFLSLASIESFRSKDPSTQNGVCIIDPENMTPLVMGYNGFPRGCSDDDFPWAREDANNDKNNTKYPYVEHAERNAIFFAAKKGISLDGAHMYLYSEKGYYSCDECTRAIIQAGIKRVVMGFAIKENTDKYDWTATLRMYRASGVKLDVISLNSNNFDRFVKLREDFGIISKKMSAIHNYLCNTES